MKIRTSFVANSSSSSYTCNVCGEEYSGMDACLSDADMYQCEYGHTFCEHHMNKELYNEYKQKKIEEIMKENNCNEDEAEDKFYEYDYDLRYNFPSEICPCCRLEAITNNDLLSYMLFKMGISEDVAETMFKTEFENLQEFKKVENKS